MFDIRLVAWAEEAENFAKINDDWKKNARELNWRDEEIPLAWSF